MIVSTPPSPLPIVHEAHVLALLEHLGDDVFVKHNVDIGEEDVVAESQHVLDNLKLGRHEGEELGPVVLELLGHCGLGDVERLGEPRVEIRLPPTRLKLHVRLHVHGIDKVPVDALLVGLSLPGVRLVTRTTYGCQQMVFCDCK
jgi:hypothetical protein